MLCRNERRIKSELPPAADAGADGLEVVGVVGVEREVVGIQRLRWANLIRLASCGNAAEWNDRPMSTRSLGDKALTLSALLAILAVVGWVKWLWLRRWWDSVNHREPVQTGHA